MVHRCVFLHAQRDHRVTTLAKTKEVQAYDALVSSQVLSHDDLELVMEEALRGPADVPSLLMDKYKIPKESLLTCLGEYYGCPTLEYDECVSMNPALLKHLSMDYLKLHYWLPLHQDKTCLDVLTDDPHDLEKCRDIKRAFPGCTLRFLVGLRRDISLFLLRAMGQRKTHSISDILGEIERETSPDQLEDTVGGALHGHDSAIVRLVNQIITDAYRQGSSDIHIEPSLNKQDTIVRFRVDGTCLPYMKIPATCRRAIVSRLKIMADLDIAERRKPQDGKIKFVLADQRDIELRVATIPTAGAHEDVVLRILTAREPLPLVAMDLSARSLGELRRIAEKPYGIILSVGPTGSGKTTALHALLNSINTPERKIWTAEDPIEITQEGLRQVQVHPKIGFTFAVALRAFLRADPDVIMIGEMRDKETADIALEASLTGHLVLSTLHTNSSVETITRLLDMGCEAFNFADAMLGILAKRLCKRMCDGCREEYRPSMTEFDELVQGYGRESWEGLGVRYDREFRLFRGRGCAACNRTGFKGRIALHELLLGTEEIRSLIQSKATTNSMLRVALQEGMTTLVQDGIQKVLQGQTTYQQVQRVAIK